MIEFAPRSKEPMLYDEAILYCRFLEHNEHKDWRMPTQDEYRASSMITGWYMENRYNNSVTLLFVFPVRDV
jgi:hypothetical protein